MEPTLESTRVSEEYASSLNDLTVNSKPLINMLTMLADDYIEHSATIVRTIENHLQKVTHDVKLPVLYLIDSIVKNVGKEYTSLFTQNIVSNFCTVFEHVDEKTRAQMFKLRQTWVDVFPPKKLYALDARVNAIDPAWPITAPPPQGRIHVNPKFLNTAVTTPVTAPVIKPAETISTSSITSIADTAMRGELLKKQKELLELQKRKVELELLQTKAYLEEQQKKLVDQASTRVSDSSILGVKPPTLRPLVPEPLPTRPKSVVVAKQEEPVAKIPEAKAHVEPRPTVQTKSEKSESSSTRRRDPRLSRKEADPRLSRREDEVRPSKKVEESRSSKGNEEVKASKKEEEVKESKSEDESRNLRKEDELKEVRKDEEAKPARKDVDPRLSRREGDPRLARREDPRLRSRKESHLVPALPKVETKAPLKEVLPDDKKQRMASNISPKSRKKSDRTRKREKDPKPRMKALFGDSPEHEPIALKNKDLPTSPKKSPSKDRKNKTKRPDQDEPVLEEEQPKIREVRKDTYETKITESPKRKIEKILNLTDTREDKRDVPREEPFVEELIPPPPPIIDFECRDQYLSDRHEPIPMEIEEKANDEPEMSDKIQVNEQILMEVDQNKFDVKPPDLPPANECGDTDLRLLVPQTKDQEQPPKKKAKPDLELFGAEDVDLRRTLVPPPPPPPIISKSDFNKSEGWANFKRSNSDRGDEPPGKSPQKKKFLMSSPRAAIFKKKKEEEEEEEEELIEPETLDRDHADKQNSLIRIMKEAEEQLRNNTITYAQYNQMLKGVVSMNEENKLQEALMKDDYERIDSPDNSGPDSPGNLHHHSDKDSSRSPERREGREDRSSDHPDSGDMEMLEGRRRARLKSHDPYYRQKDSKHGRQFATQPEPSGQFYREGGKPWLPRQQFPLRSRKEPGFMRWQYQPGGRQRQSEYSILGPPMGRQGRGSRQMSDGVVLPPADPGVLSLIEADPMTYVNVGKNVKEVRFYGENAIVMMDWDDPRDLMFQPGSRRVFIDGVDVLTLQFNAPYRDYTLSYGQRIRIRLGAPTRELFIDGRFYEVKFGGAPVEINLGMRKHQIRLEGPLPYLSIGTAKRMDLVAGKVNLIIDGNVENIFPIYLDAKPQKIEIDGIPLIVRFVESLQTVVINGQPLKMQFGGLPVPIVINGERHFLRLTMLPPGIIPGQVSILNMEGSPAPRLLPPPPPIIGDMVPPIAPPPPFLSQSEFPQDSRAPYTVPQDFPQYSVSDKPVDMLTSLMPASLPGYNVQTYQVEPYQEGPAGTSTASTAPVATGATPNIDVVQLFQKLVAMGVVPKKKEEDKEEPEDKTTIKPVDFSKPETLKVKQPALINRLYSGIQCSSCGVRFSPEQTVKYSQHLDWHFRQNRRERNSSRTAQSRRWNYDVSDWIQYQEIEDDEDRAQSWFEIQDKKSTEEEEEGFEPTVPAKGFGENPCCTGCRDKFDQFFNEEKEEWQLKRAVISEDKLYHPMCLKGEGKTVEPVLMPLVEEEPIETIDLDDAGGESGEEDKNKLETIDVESSSKSPVESDDKGDVEIIDGGDEKKEEKEKEETENEEKEKEEKETETEEKEEVESKEMEVTAAEEAEEDNSDDDILAIEEIKPHIESYDILDDDEEEEEANKDDKDEENDTEKAEIDANDSKIDDSEKEEEVKAEVVIKTEPMDITNPNPTHTAHVYETINLDGNSEFSAPTIQIPRRIKINISSMTNKNHTEENNSQPFGVDEGSLDGMGGGDYSLGEPLPPGEEPPLTSHLKPKLIGMRLVELPPVDRGREMSGLCVIM